MLSSQQCIYSVVYLSVVTWYTTSVMCFLVKMFSCKQSGVRIWSLLPTSKSISLQVYEIDASLWCGTLGTFMYETR